MTKNDMEGIAKGDRAEERQAQGRQRRQRYIDYTLRGLRPRYLQRKAHEYLVENPNATRNDFSTRIIQRDVSYQVSWNFLNDEKDQNPIGSIGTWNEKSSFRATRTPSQCIREHPITWS